MPQCPIAGDANVPTFTLNGHPSVLCNFVEVMKMVSEGVNCLHDVYTLSASMLSNKLFSAVDWT